MDNIFDGVNEGVNEGVNDIFKDITLNIQNRKKYIENLSLNNKLFSAKEKLMQEQNKLNQQSEFLKEFGINNIKYGK